MARFLSDKPFFDPHGRGGAPHVRITPPFHRPPGSGARNEQERIVLIANPRAAAGAVGREIASLERAVDRAFVQWEIWLTEGPGHAVELAAEAVEGGADLVAAVGGDGTCNEVVNGLFDGERVRSRKVAFTLIPFGTGSDLQKSLRTPRTLKNALFVAATGVTLPSDVGMASFQTDAGTRTRLFVNVAGFGANGDVVKRVESMDKSVGGRLTFFRATVESALEYEPPVVRVHWTGPEGPGSYEGPLMAAFVANGEYCGGGMNVGRGGSMQDGAFDLLLLQPRRFLRQLADARHLYRGTVERMSGAVRVRAHEVHAEATDGAVVDMDLDGEGVGGLPVSFRVLERALPIRGGWLHQTIAP